MYSKKEIDDFFQNNNGLINFQGKVDDLIFDVLLNIFKSREDIQKLIYIVNKEKHIDILVNDYGLDIRSISNIDRIWNDDYTLEHLSSLHKYKSSSLLKIQLHILSKYESVKNSFKDISPELKETVGFIIENMYNAPHFLGIDVFNFLDIIKDKGRNNRDFIYYFSFNKEYCSFSQKEYPEKDFIDYFDILGKENFLEVYLTERPFSSKNIIQLLKHERLILSDFNIIFNEHRKIVEYKNKPEKVPLFYYLLRNIKDNNILDEKMKFKKEIDLSILNINPQNLFNILRNTSLDNLISFIKALPTEHEELLNIETKIENFFTISLHLLHVLLEKNKTKGLEKNVKDAALIFNDFINYFYENGGNVFYEYNNENSIVRHYMKDYDLLKCLIHSDIMSKSEFLPLKKSMIMKINNSSEFLAILLKHEIIDNEKSYIKDHIISIDSEVIKNKKRM